MGYNSNDLYYQPGAFNIQTIGEIEWTDASYEFDLTVVWQSKEDPAVFYWASDSGCSCPSPFEDFQSLSDAHKGTKAEAIEFLLSTLKEVQESTWRHHDPSDDVVELVGKLVRL